jgi:hypothetical protein
MRHRGRRLWPPPSWAAGEDVVTIVDEFVGVTGTRGQTIVAVVGRGL